MWVVDEDVLLLATPGDNLAMPRFLQTRRQDSPPRLALTMLPTERRGVTPDFKSLCPDLGEESVMPKKVFSPRELNLSQDFSK